ncbi:hypothetical protein [uncultured Sphingomonas sp.]|uniref:hypothetical protein n=1 Tax=uncultured Sphingomonas sp. TaxID=158754 RepID=UPI0035CC7654
MTDQSGNGNDPKTDTENSAGKAQGGGDSSGAGNILAGVQPEAEDASSESERRDS